MSTTARPDKTVLVVEDDPWIRSLMADLLAGEGYSVVQASDGRAGLEMAEMNDPDVILLDLAMPEKSGLDVLHELKSSKPTRDIPVIVDLYKKGLLDLDSMVSKTYPMEQFHTVVEDMHGGTLARGVLTF